MFVSWSTARRRGDSRLPDGHQDGGGGRGDQRPAQRQPAHLHQGDILCRHLGVLRPRFLRHSAPGH